MAEDREPDVVLEMLSQPRLLAPARAMVETLARRIGFDEILGSQISLSIDEALCNIIIHGYERRPDGHIRIRIWDLGGDPPGIRIILEDDARQVDPESIRPRDLDDIRPGGLGVYIIREIMDETTYERREGGGMRLTLVKRAPEPSSETVTDSIPATGTRRGSGAGSAVPSPGREREERHE